MSNIYITLCQNIRLHCEKKPNKLYIEVGKLRVTFKGYFGTSIRNYTSIIHHLIKEKILLLINNKCS